MELKPSPDLHLHLHIDNALIVCALPRMLFCIGVVSSRCGCYLYFCHYFDLSSLHPLAVCVANTRVPKWEGQIINQAFVALHHYEQSINDDQYRGSRYGTLICRSAFQIHFKTF